jgi:hypothetical protein
MKTDSWFLPKLTTSSEAIAVKTNASIARGILAKRKLISHRIVSSDQFDR